MESCPSCGEEGAYVGALFVECPNKKCGFYSERQRMYRIEDSLNKVKKQSSDPDKTPPYPFGIDFRFYDNDVD